ncbi:30S ribosomal protein S9 [Roseibacillus ishigakijimensis]|uniref:Small ribosomal subunit protein uS9 n=1 Tax=Roseibacillus ishigakijimensis TaxID=454146 RepID=A0A934RLH5_9BACT|nr:30S ribosomal protein S9 [Roseibacillus ishigakijimensis]MBK1833033.1 30S ribosomal protein S9 [Roseibacillus ishigakijimensis]
MATANEFTATGRRKTAVARVYLTEGSGVIEINGRSFEDYFATLPLQSHVLEPFQVANLMNKFDVRISTKGGGLHGQAGAVKLAIARSLLQVDPELRPALKAAGLLRRDPRAKERKKSGQPGARKRFQFSKR